MKTEPDEARMTAIEHAHRTIRNLRKTLEHTADVQNAEVKQSRTAYQNAQKMWETIYHSLTGHPYQATPTNAEQYEVWVYERGDAGEYGGGVSRRGPTLEEAYKNAKAAFLTQGAIPKEEPS